MMDALRVVTMSRVLSKSMRVIYAVMSVPRYLLVSGFHRNDELGYALRNAGDVMKAIRGIVMLAIAEVRRAVSLVVK